MKKIEQTVYLVMFGNPLENGKYRVTSTVNTTSPKIGDSLTEKEVNDLILDGIKVVIK